MFGYIFLYSLGLIYARVSTSTLRSRFYNISRFQLQTNEIVTSLMSLFFSGKRLSIIWLFCGGLSFWLLYLLIQLFVEAHFSLQPSRRLANMPYSLAMVILSLFNTKIIIRQFYLGVTFFHFRIWPSTVQLLCTST